LSNWLITALIGSAVTLELYIIVYTKRTLFHRIAETFSQITRASDPTAKRTQVRTPCGRVEPWTSSFTLFHLVV